MYLFSTLLGLPAHALLVHAAVVLVPLAGLALAATGWRAGWRKAYSLPVALIAAAGGLFAILAAQTGGALQRSVRDAAEAAGAGRPRFGEHPQQGNSAEFFAIVLAVTPSASGRSTAGTTIRAAEVVADGVLCRRLAAGAPRHPLDDRGRPFGRAAGVERRGLVRRGSVRRDRQGAQPPALEPAARARDCGRRRPTAAQ